MQRLSSVFYPQVCPYRFLFFHMEINPSMESSANVLRIQSKNSLDGEKERKLMFWHHAQNLYDLICFSIHQKKSFKITGLE